MGIEATNQYTGGKKITIETWPLDQVSVLKGKKFEFDSLAEMIVTRAAEIPDKPFLYFYDQTITYRQINERANKVANFLTGRGIKKGDFVSFLVLNSPENLYIMFGIQKIGAISGAINFMLQGPEIAYLLDDSKPKIVFVGSEFMKPFAAGFEQANHKPMVVEVATGIEHTFKTVDATLADIMKNYPDDEALVPQKPDDPFLLLYSSGTTGRPKGILLKNAGQLALCKSQASMNCCNEGDVMLMVLPYFHVNPICVWTYPIIFGGQTICLRKGPSPNDFWEPILDYGVTIVMGVPALYAFVLFTVDPEKIDRSRLKLRYAFSGAAPMPVDIINTFKDKFNTEIIEGYGLSESHGMSTVNPLLAKRKPGSVGVAMPGNEVKIMDDNHREMAVGSPGEICIKGDQVMICYFNQPEATKETIKDGWLHTGDMGYMDDEGFIYIVDRKKEMINRGGENIYPREVEMAIETHPKIRDVAVIGIPDPALTEQVKAYIILHENQTLTYEELKEYLKDKLARYKTPSTIELVKDFPRNPTGKVMKKELKRLEQEKAGKI
ncbi:MAG TPA: AMP-binding protein [Smithella sp.]|nr:AMP-binding protein [Smithella sp.]